MRIEMAAADLRAVLKLVGQAAATKAVQPVLTGVKMEAADDRLTVTATDLEVGLRATVPCHVRRAGACCVDHGLLGKVLAEVDGAVEVLADGDTVRVKVIGRKDKWDLPYRDPAEFPAFADDNGGVAVTADAGGLGRAIRQSEYACNRRDSSPRYSVNGLRVEAWERGLMLVGTDLKRIGAGECPAAVAGDLPADTLVPLKAVKLLAGLLAGGGEAVLRVGRNDVLAECGGAVLYSRLVAGKFPAWRAIVPKGAAHAFPLDPVGFGAAVRKAAVTSDDEGKRVDVRFAPGLATITARGAESGASEVEVEVPGCDFEAAIAFDPAYLLDVFKAAADAGAASVEVEMTDGEKPAVFRWDGGMGMVMPLSPD